MDHEPLPVVGEAATEPRTRSGRIVAGVLVSLVVLGAIFAVITFRRLVGEPFGSTRAMPADADFVFTIDLLRLTEGDRFDRIVEAFTDSFAAAGMTDEGFDLLGTIDGRLAEEAGFTVADDIAPWIGRSISAAAWFDGRRLIETGEVGFVVAVEVRDRAGAESFVDFAMREVVTADGGTIERSTLEGYDVAIYTPESQFDEPIFVVFQEDMLLIGASDEGVRSAIEATEGASIADDAQFEAAMGVLSPDRFASIYVSPNAIQDIIDASGSVGTPGLPFSETGLFGTALALTLTDEGLVVDAVQLLDDTAAANIATDLALDAPMLPHRLPADTVGFTSIAIPEGLGDDQLEELRAVDPFTYDAMTETAEEFLGVDLIGEFLPSLGGEALLAVVEADEGFLADEFGVPIDVMLGISVTNRDVIADVLGRLEDLARDFGTDVEHAGQVSIIADVGRPIFAYWLGDTELVLGMSPDGVGDFSRATGGLVESNVYRSFDRAVIGEGLAFYLDMTRLLALIPEAEEFRTALAPLVGLGAGSMVVDGAVQGQLLIAVDY